MNKWKWTNGKSFPVATVKQLNNYMLSILYEEDPDTAIIHVDINNFLYKENWMTLGNLCKKSSKFSYYAGVTKSNIFLSPDLPILVKFP